MATSQGGFRRLVSRVAWPTALISVLTLLAGCAPAPSDGSESGPRSTGSASVAPPDRTLSPSPSPDANPTRTWPSSTTTGVPVGTELTQWTGDCTVTEAGTVIDAHIVDCDLRIRAADVVITRSVINGSVILRDLDSGYSFSITDSEIHVGPRLHTGLGNGHFTALRVEISGGRRSAYCATGCTIEDSWVHSQTGDPGGKAHLSGIRMGQNTTLRNNRIICEGDRIPPGSGCSAALTGYGDFSPVANNLIEGNFFHSGNASFCAFGGSTREKPFSDEAHNVRFIDNVFERDADGSCGILGPIVAFDSEAPGNVWEGNTWADGEPLTPRN